jgi:L-asparagine permease
MGRGAFQAVPQWTIALIALVIVLTVNMISVKLFGEMEFWAVRIKVVALATFLVVGIEFLAGRHDRRREHWHVVIADNGGILQRPSFCCSAPVHHATLVFLAAVTALMCYETYWNLVALVVIVPALVGG